MSGYESHQGECTLQNLNVLNKFADLGIYDYTAYLYLDFYLYNAMLLDILRAYADFISLVSISQLSGIQIDLSVVAHSPNRI